MTDRLCDATDCDQPSVVRSWCLPHYRRWKRFGDPNYVGRTRRAPEPKTSCSITGCTRSGPIIRDLCPFHYRRWRTHGDPLVVKKGQHGTSSERFWRMVIKDGPIPEGRPDLGPVLAVARVSRQRWLRETQGFKRHIHGCSSSRLRGTHRPHPGWTTARPSLSE